MNLNNIIKHNRPATLPCLHEEAMLGFIKPVWESVELFHWYGIGWDAVQFM